MRSPTSELRNTNVIRNISKSSAISKTRKTNGIRKISK